MKRINLIITLMIAILLLPAYLYAWNGYNFDSDNYIEIEDPASVVPGKKIEIYDHEDESYHHVLIISVTKKDITFIEVFDHDTGDYRTFEMEDETKAQESAFSS